MRKGSSEYGLENPNKRLTTDSTYEYGKRLTTDST